jgi:hypothetical protein
MQQVPTLASNLAKPVFLVHRTSLPTVSQSAHVIAGAADSSGSSIHDKFTTPERGVGLSSTSGFSTSSALSSFLSSPGFIHNHNHNHSTTTTNSTTAVLLQPQPTQFIMASIASAGPVTVSSVNNHATNATSSLNNHINVIAPTAHSASLPSIAELKHWKITQSFTVPEVLDMPLTAHSTSLGSTSGSLATPLIQITPSLDSNATDHMLLAPYADELSLAEEQLLLDALAEDSQSLEQAAIGAPPLRASSACTSSASSSGSSSSGLNSSSSLLPAFSSLQSAPCGLTYNEFPTELNPKFVDEEDFMFLDELDDAVGVDLYDPDATDSYLLHPTIKMEDAFQVDRLQLKSSPTLAELNLGENDDLLEHLGLQPPTRSIRTWRSSAILEDDPLSAAASLYGHAVVNGSGGSLCSPALLLNGATLAAVAAHTSTSSASSITVATNNLFNSRSQSTCASSSAINNSNHRVLCNLLNQRPGATLPIVSTTSSVLVDTSVGSSSSSGTLFGLRTPTALDSTALTANGAESVLQASTGSAQLRLPNRSRPVGSRNRNSSMSTEYSFSSSHDEGFASQAEEDELDEKMDEDTDRCSNETDRQSPDSSGRTPEPNDDEQLPSTSGKTARPRPNGVDSSSKAKRVKLTSISSTSSTSLTLSANALTGNAPQSSRQRLNSKCSMRSFGDRSEEDKCDGDFSSDDEDDESFYGDYEAKDLIGACTSDDVNNRWSLNMGRTRKNCAQRYFWQYNVQSKGPKGSKLPSTTECDWAEMDNLTPPTALETTVTVDADLEPLDPVFSPNCQIEGVKHAGKARRGDGNDLTPNPRKLLMIGLELKKLSKVINELTPVAEVPAGSKPNSRKEKNKLASRACRLKKKAQHEANKIKLHGLSAEQRKLLSQLTEMRRALSPAGNAIGSATNGSVRIDTQVLQHVRSSQGSLGSWMRRSQQVHAPSVAVAGHSTDFVNSVLDQVSAGNCNGGLDKL